MEAIEYYRDKNLPIFEIKSCNAAVHSSKEHYHEELSVGFVELGSTEVNCCGRAYQVGPRTAVLILPEVIHKCTPKKVKDWRFDMLYLKRDWKEAAFGPRLDNRAFLVKSLKAEDFFRVKNLIQRLKSNCSGMEKETRLIAGLDYLFGLDSCFDERLRMDSNNLRAVMLVRDYIHGNYLNRITLDDLSQCSGLSKYYIVRLFKQAFGTTPHTYALVLRMNHAREALKRGVDIAAAAQEAGFYDQSHFNKAFKQYFGVAPAGYIKASGKIS